MKTGIVQNILADRYPVGQRDLATQKVKGEAGKGHDAKAPDLNENEDHRLTGKRKKTACVDHGEAGDTGGRSCREEGIEPGDGLAVQAERGVQQESAEGYDSGKENYGHGKRRQHRFHVD